MDDARTIGQEPTKTKRLKPGSRKFNAGLKFRNSRLPKKPEIENITTHRRPHLLPRCTASGVAWQSRLVTTKQL